MSDLSEKTISKTESTQALLTVYLEKKLMV